MCEKFYYDRLRNDRALGNRNLITTRTPNNKNNVRSHWGPVSGSKICYSIGVFISAIGWLYQLSEKLDDPINSDRSNLPSATTSYISALYFTCTSLTSVGFGNVSPNTSAEKVFSIAAMLIGGTRNQTRTSSRDVFTPPAHPYIAIFELVRPFDHRMMP